MPESRNCPQCYSRQVAPLRETAKGTEYVCQQCGKQWITIEISIADAVTQPGDKPPKSVA
jgi:hypothetical protein